MLNVAFNVGTKVTVALAGAAVTAVGAYITTRAIKHRQKHNDVIIQKYGDLHLETLDRDERISRIDEAINKKIITAEEIFKAEKIIYKKQNPLKIQKFFNKAWQFIKDVFWTTVYTVNNTALDMWQNLETVILLLFASYGILCVFSTIPFFMFLPIWIESSFVATILSILGVSLLVQIAKWREKNAAVKVATT